MDKWTTVWLNRLKVKDLTKRYYVDNTFGECGKIITGREYNAALREIIMERKPKDDDEMEQCIPHAEDFASYTECFAEELEPYKYGDIVTAWNTASTITDFWEILKKKKKGGWHNPASAENGKKGGRPKKQA